MSSRKRSLFEMNDYEDMNNDNPVPRKKQRMNDIYPKCICGVALKPMEAKDVYPNNWLFNGSCHCDGGCNITYRGDVIMWHCVKGKINKHKYGYDICNKCIKNIFKNLFKTKIYKNIKDINSCAILYESIYLSPLCIKLSISSTICKIIAE